MGKLEVFSLSEYDKDAFVAKYKPFYFIDGETLDDEKTLLGTVLQHKTEKLVEAYADNVLDGRLFDKRLFLWKAGRLTANQAELEDPNLIRQIKVVNGRGREIENAEEFIDAVRGKEVFSKGMAGFEADYRELLKESKQKGLKNVGAVYLITVLFFLSNRKYPIYDFFAHRAVKALYLGKNPTNVFVGAAPDKKEVDKVLAMYREYVYLLDQVFGYHNIERELDRALWVYGHANQLRPKKDDKLV